MEATDLGVARRHSGSHIMTFATKMTFPDADIKLGVGPWTDSEFYQDFDFGGLKISEKDLKEIEKKMRWVVNKNFKIVKKIVSYKEAKEIFKSDPYKMELLEGIAERGEEASLYDFINEEGNTVYRDLCAGPHLESTGQLGVFKLIRLSGSYWRGDENRPMLTRIYGVAFETEEELKEYERIIEEAKQRDHRKIGSELDLFCFSEKVGSGLPLFSPKGAFLRNRVAEVIQKIQSKYGYTPVWIPHITKKDLYETSGHWQKFKDDLFHVHGKGTTEFVMKPMNCPHHTQIFASQMRSYRDLPVRYSEVTTCYRDEQPGELLGLSRVRSLTQDDGHAFCRIEQVKKECENVLKIIQEFHTLTGLYREGQFEVQLSIRDPKTPEKYLGKDENWKKAETFLAQVLEEANLKYRKAEGEAAFYGPKIDFQFYDALKRKWQLSTIQVDFVMPERFGLEFINEKGEKETPVMIHRAIAGSLERFISVIIEHYAGHFPLWLAPLQAQILPVAKTHEAFAQALLEEIKNAEGRAELISADETLGKRIRNAQTQKINYAIIVGDEESKSNILTIREYGKESDEKITREKFLEKIKSANL